MRTLRVVVCAVLLCGGGTQVSGTAGAPAPVGAPPRTAPGYEPPLAGRLIVVRAFERPPTPYAAGHRGVDLAGARGEAVLAAGAGTVQFAGHVAGRGVVVIAHPDGLRTEYEPLRVVVSAGQRVSRGQLIGRLQGRHGTCPPGGCLHWGARRGERYLDPMLLLHALGPVRLLPWRAASGTTLAP